MAGFSAGGPGSALRRYGSRLSHLSYLAYANSTGDADIANALGDAGLAYTDASFVRRTYYERRAAADTGTASGLCAQLGY